MLVICFISQCKKRSKHELFVFPPKKTLIWEGIVWLANHVAVWRQSKVLIDNFLDSFSGMKFFKPSVCLTNQKPLAFVSIWQTNQINIALFLHWFVVSAFFTRFHFQVIRKLLHTKLGNLLLFPLFSAPGAYFLSMLNWGRVERCISRYRSTNSETCLFIYLFI